MVFRPYPGTRKDIDLITGIAPIFRVDISTSKVHLIGTGFWVTDMGHLVTAWHVVQENIDENDKDYGPIFAIQTFPDRSIVARSFRKSDKHPLFDLALSETVTSSLSIDRPTMPVTMSLDELSIGQPVFSFAVLAEDQGKENEKFPDHTVYRFHGEISGDYFHEPTPIKYGVRLSFGKVSMIFEQMRDTVMMPFPCVQTDLSIFGGNSGGPLFDVRGRVCAVHCTSFGENDIAFHIPIQGVLQLQARTESLKIKDIVRTQRSICELAIMQKVSFDPPMFNGDRFLTSVLRLLWYLTKCLIRRERPSTIHFATTREYEGSENSEKYF